MKTRLLALVLFTLPLAILAAAPAEKAGPNPTVTTTKRSAIQVGSSSFALIKGTKLEVLGREGKLLLVKYRTSQGKIPYADTDFVLSEEEKYEEETAEAEAVAAAPVKPPAPAPAKPASPAPPATVTKTPPPAVATGGIRPATAGTDPVPTAAGNQAPVTNYGKAVQKAKQVEQAHKEKLVNPADEILDEKPKK